MYLLLFFRKNCKKLPYRLQNILTITIFINYFENMKILLLSQNQNNIKKKQFQIREKQLKGKTQPLARDMN